MEVNFVMERNEIKDRIVKLCLEVMNVTEESNIAESKNLVDDFGLNSIMFITLIVEIEDDFDITIPDQLLSVEHFNTIDAAVDIVSKLSLNN